MLVLPPFPHERAKTMPVKDGYESFTVRIWYRFLDDPTEHTYETAVRIKLSDPYTDVEDIALERFYGLYPDCEINSADIRPIECE